LGALGTYALNQHNGFAETDPQFLETRVLGQNEWLAGSRASLRVIVRDHQEDKPLRAAVWLYLASVNDEGKADDANARKLLSARTGTDGVLNAEFDVPKLRPGSYELRVKVETSAGNDEVRQPVTLAEKSRVLLVTDKPLYQPGQTVHIRALTLSVPARQPVAAETTIEVEDAKGNKVFRKTCAASKFGIASADFDLASEVNMGAYTVRATLESGTAERKVEVKRYVLPKFKVTATTDRKYYLPGEKVTGKVQADYFFGKPVSGGNVMVKCSTFVVDQQQFAELAGKTDETGLHKFEFDLPDYLVGQPLEQGKAVVLMDVTVADKAEHEETVSASVPVAKEPIQLLIVPESGKIVPGVDNLLYLSASYPDGAPAQCDLQVSTTWERARHTLTTDALGIAELSVRPGKDPGTITVRAADKQGQRAVKTQELEFEGAAESVLLRTDKAVANVGDSVRVSVLAPQGGTAYLDVIRERQTVLTRSLDLKDGKAETDLPLTADLSGTLELHAYKILPSEDVVRDTRIVYVNPADDLSIEVKPGRDTYRPGDPGRIDFTVTDKQKHPILAALGVAVVDESVFALQEMQPGLEKVYFTLEQELMKPRYEIHGLTPAGLIGGDLPVPMRPDPAEQAKLRQEAAKVLFAAVEPMTELTLKVNSYAQRVERRRDEWTKRITKDAESLMKALQRFQKLHKRFPTKREGLDVLVREKLLSRAALLDPWGNPYRLEGDPDPVTYVLLSSPGMDGRWGTVDDLMSIGPFQLQRQERFFALGDMMALDAAARGPMGAPGVAGQPGAAGGMMKMAEAQAPAEGAPGKDGGGGGATPTRVRQFFPETMFWNPAIITDERGRASVDLAMADSITTWRLTAMASAMGGQLGSATAPVRVFQDFFVDIDLPVALTQNDEVSIPVALYNYLDGPQTVSLELESGDWFEMVTGPDGKAGQTKVPVPLEKGQVTVRYFPLQVKKLGRHSLTVHAKGTKLSDAIRREIEVLPDGEETYQTINDRLDGNVEKTVVLPKEAIDDASTIFVRIYPGTFSQVVDGLDSMLRMPSGCFEQTSSTTYPNVLVMNYMKSTKQINPEIQMKAEGFINAGYQRLVSYEVDGGGFSWFGDAPAHKVLTAYGLMEFSDMAKVHNVDPALIQRTQQWLVDKQKGDGTWDVDQGGIAEGIINRQTDELRVTAYVAWALADSGFKGAQLNKSAAYVGRNIGKVDDPYAMAVITNLLAAIDRNSADAIAAADRLAKLATEQEKVAYWQTDAKTMTCARDDTADLETTALAAYALLKSGRHGGLANKALTYLTQKKDAFGTWQTTQATVWAFKALLLAMETATAGDTNAEITLDVNGKRAGACDLTPENADVMRQFDLKEFIREGDNQVKISFSGKGSALYQIVSKYYLPWKNAGKPDQPVLDIKVDYDKTDLKTDDTVTAKATVRNLTNARADMVVLDLGIPPGFDVQTGDLAELVGTKIKKFTMAARQIIVYLDKLDAGQTLELQYRLKAKFPVKAKTPKSTAYEYYNPGDKATAEPVEMVVRGA
jgi:uncharacterized protein YfaS (alpha-2-macroglobulin family)